MQINTENMQETFSMLKSFVVVESSRKTSEDFELFGEKTFFFLFFNFNPDVKF